MEKLYEVFLQQGITGALLLLALVYFDRRIRPRMEERDNERDKMIEARVLAADQLHSDRMKEMIADRREAEHMWSEREQAQRKEHAANFEMLRVQAREERIADRELYRELIGQVSQGFDKLTDAYNSGVVNLKEGQDRNFTLTMVMAEKQGHSKSQLVERVEEITGKKVPQKQMYDTQAPD